MGTVEGLRAWAGESNHMRLEGAWRLVEMRVEGSSRGDLKGLTLARRARIQTLFCLAPELLALNLTSLFPSNPPGSLGSLLE